MAQFDFGTLDPATVSGTTLASDLTSWRDALNSAHSGNAAPTYAIAGMSWLDNSATPWVLKRYDGASWVTLGTINPTTHVWTPVAPTQANGDNSTNVATTAFVVNALADVAASNASETVAGIIKLATQAQAEAGSESGAIAMSPLRVKQQIDTRLVTMLCNVRETLTASGLWTSPVDGWVRYTVIGGGGAGTSWLSGSGNQLAWGTPGGDTTFGGITALGGATSRALPYSAVVARRYRVGGGCAGQVITGYLRVSQGQSISYTIGAGGLAGAGTATTGYTANPGTDTTNNTTGSSTQSWGGNGARTGLGYGGGGGACGSTWGADSLSFSPHSPGYGHDGGAHAIDATAQPLLGGNGGQGAVILEYYNPGVA